jgi:hypothetical protein
MRLAQLMWGSVLFSPIDMGTVPKHVGRTIFSFHLMWEVWPLLMDGKHQSSGGLYHYIGPQLMAGTHFNSRPHAEGSMMTFLVWNFASTF